MSQHGPTLRAAVKKDLTALYLDKLRSQYRDIKNEIQVNMLELEQILEEDQMKEI
jgi:hypothetical protein